jgi:hypothetical protein
MFNFKHLKATVYLLAIGVAGAGGGGGGVTSNALSHCCTVAPMRKFTHIRE